MQTAFNALCSMFFLLVVAGTILFMLVIINELLNQLLK